MSTAMLNRLAGGAAIFAGVLRAAGSFAYQLLETPETDLLFLVADIFLLFALIGIYGLVARAAGWAGLAGFAAAVVGIVIVRSAAGIIDTYLVGAAVLAIGVAVLGVAMIAQRAFPRAAPALWIAGPIVGVAAYLLESDWLFETASVVFAAGFAVAGVEIVRLRPAAAEVGDGHDRH